MPPIQQGPYYKTCLNQLTYAMNKLTDHEQGRLHRLSQDLANENHKLGGPVTGFRYKGFAFLLYGKLKRSYTFLPAPHETLVDRAESLYQQFHTLKHNAAYLRQTSYSISLHCHSRQDLRNALPDSLEIIMPELFSLPRTREEGELLRSYPALRSQYLSSFEIIEDYIANRLIYS